jgi:hypothetical protein
MEGRRQKAEEYVKRNPEYRYARLPLGQYKIETGQRCYVIGVFRLEASFMTENYTDKHGKSVMKTQATLVDFVIPKWMEGAFEKSEFEETEWSSGYFRIKKGLNTVASGLYKTIEDATFDE